MSRSASSSRRPAVSPSARSLKVSRVSCSSSERARGGFSTAWLDLDPTTITTNNELRDGHLKGSDFFEVEKHPAITFRSTGAKPDGDTIVMTGDLTIRGVTNSVDVVWEFGGLVKDPWGATRAGFEGSATINRKEWGLTYNTALETGGVLIADKVKLVLEVEAAKRVTAGTAP